MWPPQLALGEEFMTAYTIHTEVKFPPLELIDTDRLVRECRDPWFNQTLCRINAHGRRNGP
jgi:hypothetical protein